MGGGTWTRDVFVNYTSTKSMKVTSDGMVDMSFMSAQNVFTARNLHEDLNPYNVIRECCDSEEHSNTVPVILALDVTGSMGESCKRVAQSLNVIMTDLYDTVPDVEFMIMGIGDLAYDIAPIQISQFESDIRIAEHLDKIFFEQGGGGNGFESYSAAWYMGLHHTKLDCWKRGKKGIIITMGDEPFNPYLPGRALSSATGDSLAELKEVDTSDLYKEVTELFDVYHIAVDDPHNAYRFYERSIATSIKPYFDEEHFKVSNIDDLPQIITAIVRSSAGNTVNSTNEITW